MNKKSLIMSIVAIVIVVITAISIFAINTRIQPFTAQDLPTWWYYSDEQLAEIFTDDDSYFLRHTGAGNGSLGLYRATVASPEIAIFRNIEIGDTLESILVKFPGSRGEIFEMTSGSQRRVYSRSGGFINHRVRGANLYYEPNLRLVFVESQDCPEVGRGRRIHAQITFHFDNSEILTKAEFLHFSHYES